MSVQSHTKYGNYFFFSCVNSGCTYNILCNHDCGVHEIRENNFPRNEKIFKHTSRKQYSVYNSCIIGHEIFGSFSYSVTNASDTAGSNILQIQFLYLDRNNQVGSCREVKCWSVDNILSPTFLNNSCLDLQSLWRNNLTTDIISLRSTQLNKLWIEDHE